MRRTLLKAHGFGSPTRDKPAAQAWASQGLERPWVGSSKRFSIGETWRASRRKPDVSSSALSEDRINAVKLPRACGGCLGARRRRRAWKTAISPGELSNEL